MDNIMLKDGTIAIIGSNRDVSEVVEQYCGYELASFVLDKLESVDADKAYAEARAKTDASAYERSLESAQSTFNNILDIVEEVQEHIVDAKRINKDIIYQELKKIIKLINLEI